MHLNSISTSKRIIPFVMALVLFACFMATYSPRVSHAASAEDLDISVNVALDRFRTEIPGGAEYLQNAKGVLVIPNVYKAGFFVGGEYGEGALLVGGKTVDYYNLIAGSFGFVFGAQSKSIVVVFMDLDALNKFRDSLGWRAGVDGSIVFVDYGAGASANTDNVRFPIVGFVFGLKGLMANISLEGAKFTKINK
jgi:lipid-binding SYLF domain-containing protein